MEFRKGPISPAIENITVFTDASVARGVVGGGYWIVYGDGKRLKGRVAVSGFTKSHEAEIIVAARAIWIAMEHPDLTAWALECPALRMVLVTDAMATKNAVERMSGGYHLIQPMVELLESKNIQLKVNHVKGHTNGDKPRDYVNRWCDSHAAIARRRYESHGITHEDLTFSEHTI